jgi:DNA-binding NarL/FixJ family response regulator
MDQRTAKDRMQQGPFRISIVEDEPSIRETLSSLLRMDGSFELARAYSNAEAALEGVPHDGVQLVIMDISLPGMSGIECVRQLAQQMPAAQFLMYTMHDDDHRVFDALKAGANGYLLKSSTPDEILDALHELQDGGAPMSTAVARRVINHFRPLQARREPGNEVLSDREYEVLKLLADGLLYKEIAERMGLTVGTVKQHIHRMYGKMHVQNRVEAVNKYFGR